MPFERQNADMSAAARRSISENDTWLEAIANAFSDQHPQVVGIEIGDAKVTDQALGLEGGELAQRVEPGRMPERPPVELQEIDLR